MADKRSRRDVLKLMGLVGVTWAATQLLASPETPTATPNSAVAALLPQVDAGSRTLTARVVLQNPDHRLAPGMYAEVAIDGPARAAQVLVPTEAVIATGTRRVVIVAEGQGRFRAQEVRTGIEADGQTVVREGVREGERVVASGQFLIDSEASLRGALARLQGRVLIFVQTATGFRPVPVNIVTEGVQASSVRGELKGDERIAVRGVSALKAALMGIGGE